MSAYVLVDIDVVDPEAYEEYKKLAPPTIAAYGGRYIVRGGHAETMEGEWKLNRLVILEFESVARAKQWLDSPEYSAIRDMRHQAAKSNMIIVEGL
jgi:uncharacterized protein (DUF1330 family)